MDNTRYGKEMNRWTPDAVGKDFDLKPILEPFAPLKKYMTVVSGLGNRPAESPSVHSIIPGTWLSCVAPPRSQTPNAGISVDQIAARHIGQETPLPSLELATEERGGSVGLRRHLRLQLQPHDFVPHADDAAADGSGSRQGVREDLRPRQHGRRAQRRSRATSRACSTWCTARSRTSSAASAPTDRAMVDDYLDSVRELERRIQLLGARDLSNVAVPDLPVAEPDFDEQAAS